MDIQSIQSTLKLFFSDNKINKIINSCEVTDINIKDNNKLSIVCTTNQRSEQTYFTLKSWNYIAKKNNVNFQFIIVEDTKDEKYRLEKNKLVFSNLYITYVFIKNKTWLNPCLNYNIGFNFIKSNYVVITNAEVCVFGNIYEKIKNNLKDDNYLIFDVCQTGFSMYENIDTNNELHNECNDFQYNSLISFLQKRNINWLQGININKGYHYLTAITKKTLEKVGLFDYDFSLSTRLDDRILVDKMKMYDKIKFINFFYNNHNVLGFHQWHFRNYVSNDPQSTQVINRILYKFKTDYMKKHNKYIYLYNSL